MARTIVYIDGFNLYYRALKGTAHKWLDIAAMSATVLPSGHQIQAINYYTARVSGRVDPAAPGRQHAYLRALETLPKVAIHYGNFLATKKWAGALFSRQNSAPPSHCPLAQRQQSRMCGKPRRKALMSTSALTWFVMPSKALSM
jgi:hypothetical protein